MSRAPIVSVMMSVHNSVDTLAATMDSVLSQEGVDFEFIVVDDGSTDGSGTLLDDYARHDERVRVIQQDNTGLTRALIRGCAAARGKYIARQDAGGDLSLPGRLALQCHFLESDPAIVLTSCGTVFVGPEGEHLYECIQHGDELQHGLEALDINQVRGPSHHGSVMLRRDAYHAVGGYRAEFRVAQDLDLWLRLAEVGRCVAMPAILHQARLTLGAISHARRKEQLRSARTILQCAARRRGAGGDEQAILRKFMKHDHGVSRQWLPHFVSDARFYYFVGSLLRQEQGDEAKAYFQRALQSWPFFPRALLALWLLKVRK